jgi:DNA (cytosine-5)-methyltransferase 1
VRLLDLHCGAGGCAMGYYLAGFDEIVGVDIVRQPRYPFKFIQAEAISYLMAHGHEFDAIHASPPCQAYTTLRHMPHAKKHPKLINPTRIALVKTGKPYVIENVEGARLEMRKPIMLCGTMFKLGTGNADLRRHRYFESNWKITVPKNMVCRHGYRSENGDSETIGVYGCDGRARSVNEIVRRQNRIKKTRTISVIGDHSRDCAEEHRQRRRADTIPATGHSGGSSTRTGRLYFSSAETNEAMGIDWMTRKEIVQAIPPAYTEFIGRQLIEFIKEDKDVRPHAKI